MKRSLLRRIRNINIEKIRGRLSLLYWNIRYKSSQLSGRGYPAVIDEIPTHMTKLEKYVLFKIACRVSNAAIAAEIGSYLGASSACIAAAFDANSKNASVYCIDTWMNDDMSEGGRDTFAIWRSNVSGYKSVVPVRGFSRHMAPNIPASLSLVFIDGDHSYEAVCLDIKLYAAKIGGGGFLVMHDWGYAPVRQAIEELVLPQGVKTIARLPNLYACRFR